MPPRGEDAPTAPTTSLGPFPPVRQILRCWGCATPATTLQTDSVVAASGSAALGLPGPCRRLAGGPNSAGGQSLRGSPPRDFVGTLGSSALLFLLPLLQGRLHPPHTLAPRWQRSPGRVRASRRDDVSGDVKGPGSAGEGAEDRSPGSAAHSYPPCLLGLVVTGARARRLAGEFGQVAVQDGPPGGEQAHRLPVLAAGVARRAHRSGDGPDRQAAAPNRAPE